MSYFDNLMDVSLHIHPLARQYLGDIHNHVQLFTPIDDRLARLGNLDRSGMSAMREANRCAGLYGRSAQQCCTMLEREWHDADTARVVGKSKTDPTLQ